MATCPDVLLAAMDRRYRLSDAEIEALTDLHWHTKTYPATTEIVAPRSRPVHCRVLVEGIAASCLGLSSGERQITAVHIPGDFIDLHGLLVKMMDHSVVALTDCTVTMVEHADLQKVTAAMPRLGRLLFSLVAIDAAIQRNRVLSLGRKKAQSRLADFLCELYLRCEFVGLARDFTVPLPLSQGMLSDILGLSIVHTNRTIMDLRTSGLIEWDHHIVRIKDWDGLVARGEFDFIYFNLDPEQPIRPLVRPPLHSSPTSKADEHRLTCVHRSRC